MMRECLGEAGNDHLRNLVGFNENFYKIIGRFIANEIIFIASV
jgi:hypothetical protein